MKIAFRFAIFELWRFSQVTLQLTVSRTLFSVAKKTREQLPPLRHSQNSLSAGQVLGVTTRTDGLLQHKKHGQCQGQNWPLVTKVWPSTRSSTTCLTARRLCVCAIAVSGLLWLGALGYKHQEEDSKTEANAGKTKTIQHTKKR